MTDCKWFFDLKLYLLCDILVIGIVCYLLSPRRPCSEDPDLFFGVLPSPPTWSLSSQASIAICTELLSKDPLLLGLCLVGFQSPDISTMAILTHPFSERCPIEMKMVPMWLHLGTLTRIFYRSPSHRPAGTPTCAAGWMGITFFIKSRKDCECW